MDWKNRFYAMGVHTIFSCVLLFIALYLVFKIWYPVPLDKAMGVNEIFWIILSIDLVLGPLLTFVIFNKKKKELRRDLIIIIMLQLTAYLYGLYTVAQGRPVWQVFVVDDIELVRAVDIQGENSFYRSSLIRKPGWVAAVYSDDPRVEQQQKQAEMFDGISLATRPETYQAFETRAEQIKAKVQTIDKLFAFNTQKNVRQILSMYKNTQIIGFLPVKGLKEDMTLLIGGNGQPVAIVDLKPW